MTTIMQSTKTFRILLLPIALLTLVDMLLTTFAIHVLDIGVSAEANPVATLLGGPEIMLSLKAAFLVWFAYRSRTWDKPNRIAIANSIAAFAIPWTACWMSFNTVSILYYIGVI